MKYIFVVAAFLIGINVAALIPSEDRVNGENGWYIPSNGSFYWIDMETYENKIDSEQDTQAPEGRIDFNAVHCYLYTRENSEEPQEITDTFKSISKSNFNASNPTKFVIHGWLQSDNSDMNDKIKDAWLKSGAYNIIVVQWSRAHGEYVLAVAALSAVGDKLATLIDYFYEKFNMPLDNLEIIGHSLGAHAAGYVAKHIRSGQVHKIVGLDPAMPLFSYKNTEKRLCSDDAFYVETIQTNGGKLGFKEPIGKASFYPNGGKTQPGCFLDVLGICSHARSIEYYVETIERNNFPAIKCDTYKNANKRKCGSTYGSVRMNALSNYVSASGAYYVPVNSESPFGKGE